MSGKTNKGLAIPLSTALDTNSTVVSLRQLKSMLKEQVVKIRPDIDKKSLNNVIKNALKNVTYTVDINGKIKNIGTSMQIAPGQKISSSFERVAHKKAVTEKYINPATGVLEKREIEPAVKAHWVEKGMNVTASSVPNAQLYENATKQIIDIKKRMTEAEIAGNKAGYASLKNNLEASRKEQLKFANLMKEDTDAEQFKINTSRAAHKEEQADIANENKLIGAKTKLINGHMKEIERLKISQRDMKKGDTSWVEANKQIRQSQRAIKELVGDNETLNNVRKKGYDSVRKTVSSQSEANDVIKYNKAMAERLKFDKEIGTIQEKMKMNVADNTSQNRQLISSLTAERNIRTQTMESIEKSSKGRAIENQISQQKLKYDNASQIIQERVLASSAKTKNFLRDIVSGWKDAAARVIDYTIAYRVLWGGVALIKSGIQTIYELNKAFTDIQMVTGMTTVEVNTLANSYAKLAQEYGSTIQQVAQGATEWLRQGKTSAETNELLKQSMMMSKLGAMESAEATEYLTSTMNGYKMEVEDASKIVDTFSALDMAAATSTKELAIAFQRSANSANDAGISFDQLASYITVVSETTRKSASTIGESFKTLAARYMNVKLGVAIDPESGENINDVEKALSTVGIKIRTGQNTWREFGEVINEVGGNWEHYNEMQKNTIVTAMAGVRQAENFRALLNNFSKVGDYLTIATESAGTSAEKYAVYLDSLEAKQNRLISTFQEIAYQPGFEQLYKSILDVLTIFGKFLGFVMETPVATLSLTASIAGAVLSLNKFSDNLAVTKIKGWRKALIDSVTQLDFFTASAKRSAIASKLLSVAMSPMGLASIAIGIGLIYKAWDLVSDSLEELQEKFNTTKSQLEEINEEIKILTDKDLATNSELSEEEIARLDWLKDYQQTLKDTLIITKSAEANLQLYGKGDNNPFTQGDYSEAWIRQSNDIAQGIYSATDADFEKETDEHLDRVYKETVKRQKVLQDIKKDMQDYLDSGYLDDDTAKRAEKDITNINKAMVNNEKAMDKIRDTGVVDFQIDYSDLEKTAEASSDAETQVGKLSDGLSDLVDSYNALKDAQAEIKDQGYLSSETIASLIKEYPTLTTLLARYQVGLSSTSDVIKGLEENYQSLLVAQKDSMLEALSEDEEFYAQFIENNQEYLATLDDDLEHILKSASSYSDARYKIESTLISQLSQLWAEYYSVTNSFVTNDEKLGNIRRIVQDAKNYGLLDNPNAQGYNYYKKMESDLVTMEGLVNQNKQAEEAFAKLRDGIDVKVTPKKDKASKKDKEDPYKKLDETYDKRLALSKRYIEDRNTYNDWGADSEINAWKRVKDYTEQAYKAKKMSAEKYAEAITEINRSIYEAEKSDIDKRYKGMQEAATKGIEKEKEALEESLKLWKENNQEKIDNLEKEIDLLNEKEEEENKLLEIEKAKMELEKLKGQKTKRIYKDGLGFIWEADQEAIGDAQDGYDELTKAYEKYQKERDLQKEIDELKEAEEEQERIIEEKIKHLDDLADAWSESLDLKDELITYEGDLESLLGTENTSFEARLALAQQFAKDYANAMAGLGALSGAGLGGAVSVGNSVQVGSDGNAPKGTKVGDVVQVNNGKNGYVVVPPNTPGAKQNPTNGLWSKQVYKDGGIADYTGMAQLDGTPSHVETVFNATQGKKLFNFVENIPDMTRYVATKMMQSLPKPTFLNKGGQQPVMISIGDINLSNVQDAESLSKAIVTRLPNLILQDLYKK